MNSERTLLKNRKIPSTHKASIRMIRAKKVEDFAHSLNPSQRAALLYLCGLRLADLINMVEEIKNLISIVKGNKTLEWPSDQKARCG